MLFSTSSSRDKNLENTLFSVTHLFQLIVTLMTIANVSMGLSWPEYWSGLPCPIPGVRNINSLPSYHKRQLTICLIFSSSFLPASTQPIRQYHMYLSGEENGNSFQFSCLGNPLDRGAWWALMNWTQLSDWVQAHIPISVGYVILQ